LWLRIQRKMEKSRDTLQRPVLDKLESIHKRLQSSTFTRRWYLARNALTQFKQVRSVSTEQAPFVDASCVSLAP